MDEFDYSARTSWVRKRRKRRASTWQFSLRVMLIFVALFCGTTFALYESASELVESARKLTSFVRMVRQSEAHESAPWLCAILAAPLGIVSAWGVYKLGARWGYVALCAAVLIGPPAVLSSIRVNFPAGLTVREVSWWQWAGAGALYAGASICLGAVLGFACLGLAGALSADDGKPQLRRYARMVRQRTSVGRDTAPRYDTAAPVKETAP